MLESRESSLPQARKKDIKNWQEHDWKRTRERRTLSILCSSIPRNTLARWNTVLQNCTLLFSRFHSCMASWMWLFFLVRLCFRDRGYPTVLVFVSFIPRITEKKKVSFRFRCLLVGIHRVSIVVLRDQCLVRCLLNANWSSHILVARFFLRQTS